MNKQEKPSGYESELCEFYLWAVDYNLFFPGDDYPEGSHEPNRILEKEPFR